MVLWHATSFIFSRYENSHREWAHWSLDPASTRKRTISPLKQYNNWIKMLHNNGMIPDESTMIIQLRFYEKLNIKLNNGTRSVPSRNHFQNHTPSLLLAAGWKKARRWEATTQKEKPTLCVPLSLKFLLDIDEWHKYFVTDTGIK